MFARSRMTRLKHIAKRARPKSRYKVQMATKSPSPAALSVTLLSLPASGAASNRPMVARAAKQKKRLSRKLHPFLAIDISQAEKEMH
jgi:hypothetical protein